jgi:hypothetical protein
VRVNRIHLVERWIDLRSGSGSELPFELLAGFAEAPDPSIVCKIPSPTDRSKVAAGETTASWPCGLILVLLLSSDTNGARMVLAFA